MDAQRGNHHERVSEIHLFEQKKVGEVSCLNLRIWKTQLWLRTKAMIKRLALLITKGLISQGLQIVITRITYGALTVRNLDIHGKNVGNFMVSQLHLAKNGVTMEANKGIMGKQTCLLLIQLKKNPWNRAESIRRRLKKQELC